MYLDPREEREDGITTSHKYTRSRGSHLLILVYVESKHHLGTLLGVLKLPWNVSTLKILKNGKSWNQNCCLRRPF